MKLNDREEGETQKDPSKNLFYRFFLKQHSPGLNILTFLVTFLIAGSIFYLYEKATEFFSLRCSHIQSHLIVIAGISLFISILVLLVKRIHVILRQKIKRSDERVIEALNSSEERFKMLNHLFSQMIDIKEKNEMYHFITDSLSNRYQNSIVLYMSVDESGNSFRIESLSGLNNSKLSDIFSILGHNPLGKDYEIKKDFLEIYRTATLTPIKHAFSKSSVYTDDQAKKILEVLRVGNIYAIGITQESQVLSAILFLTPEGSEINDNSFIELFVRQAAIIIRKLVAEISLREDEERLVRLNNTKDRIFSIVGHDLKNMFSGILGISDMMITHYMENPGRKNLVYLNLINSSSEQAFILLENLLSWAKTQTGQLDFDPELMNIDEMIRDVIEMLDSTAKIKNITLNHTKTCSPVAMVDRNMIKTVLRNLVQNAIKFTNRGGRVDIFAFQSIDNIEVTISDNGTGMSEEVQRNLFAVSSTMTGTANEKGSGLGLLLCHEFVRKHGGSIKVMSEVGSGSSFIISLPCKQKSLKG